MNAIEYEPAQRESGLWGVKRSNSEAIFGNYDTEAEARAAAEGATWAQLGMGQDQ